MSNIGNIIKNFEMVQNFSPEAEVASGEYTVFQTDTTKGYVPTAFVETFLDTGFFEVDYSHSQPFLKFTVLGRDAKENALNVVTQSLIEKGLIPENIVPKVQRRFIGGRDRLTNPEFDIDRAYDGYFGFELDGVVLNVVHHTEHGSNILLQQRAANTVFGNTLDFAAGGALVAPQSPFQAIQEQAADEMGVDIGSAKFTHHIHLSYFRPTETKQLMRLRQSVFTVQVDAFVNPVSFNHDEVDGFQWASPEEIVEFCRDGRFAPSHVYSMFTSLNELGMLPEFEEQSEVLERLPIMQGRNVSSDKLNFE